jgi:hypothetical protein
MRTVRVAPPPLLVSSFNAALLISMLHSGRKRKAGKLQKVLPWEQQAESDSEDHIPASAGTPPHSAKSAAAAGLPANGELHPRPVAEVEAVQAAGGGTLADYAAAEAAAIAAGQQGYGTPPSGTTPAKEELAALMRGLQEGEDGEASSPFILSPGAAVVMCLSCLCFCCSCAFARFSSGWEGGSGVEVQCCCALVQLQSSC